MMAKQGTIFYAINYALAPAHHFPDQILQIDEFLKALPQLLSKERTTYAISSISWRRFRWSNMVAEYTCMKYDALLCEKSHVQLQSLFDINGLLLYCGPYDFAEDLTNPKLKDFVKMFHYLGWAYLGKKSGQNMKKNIWLPLIIRLIKNFLLHIYVMEENIHS